MFYDFSFTIPANTLEKTPAELNCKLTSGVIHRVEVGFPPGPRYMVYCAIRKGLHQVWPTNPGGSFNSDNFTIVINEFYPLLYSPYLLTLQGWSPGTTYKHIIEVRFGILPQDVLLPEATFTQAFKQLLKRLRL